MDIFFSDHQHEVSCVVLWKSTRSLSNNLVPDVAKAFCLLPVANSLPAQPPPVAKGCLSKKLDEESSNLPPSRHLEL